MKRPLELYTSAHDAGGPLVAGCVRAFGCALRCHVPGKSMPVAAAGPVPSVCGLAAWSVVNTW
jgi:hypothetical protein